MMLTLKDAPGLNHRLMLAGLTLHFEHPQDGGAVVVFTGDDKAAQAIIDAWTVADSIAYRCNEVAARAKEVQDGFIGALGYSVGEMSTWPIKAAEVAAFTKSANQADAPTLAAEAAAAGRPFQEVFDRVKANAVAFGGFANLAAGIRTKHKDALRAQTTFADVAAYDISAGWPAV